MTPLWEKISVTLDKQGFSSVTKEVTLRTLTCGLLSLIGAAATYPANALAAKWLFWFGVAVLLSVWNFWALARFIHKNISNGWDKNLLFRLTIWTQFRLFLTAFLVYSMIVIGQAPLPAVLVGVAISLVFVVISTLSAGSRQ